ncbi:MAG: leucine-rich repeat domain-containing protein, partial [Promethearchaeota archaeon]
TKLETLVLSENFLVTLPDTIGDLGRLQELVLSLNYLKTLPDTIGNLTNLRTLDLGDPYVGYDFFTEEQDESDHVNRYSPIGITLFKEFSSKIGVTLFERVSSQFGQIPLGELYRLLDPDSNHLMSIPNTVGNLSNLETLHLQGNWLATLPDTIGNLTNLVELNLLGNPLETLPISIRNLPNLEFLRIYSPISLVSDSERCPSEVVDLLEDLRQKGCWVENSLTSMEEGMTRPPIDLSTIPQLDDVQLPSSLKHTWDKCLDGFKTGGFYAFFEELYRIIISVLHVGWYEFKEELNAKVSEYKLSEFMPFFTQLLSVRESFDSDVHYWPSEDEARELLIQACTFLSYKQIP